MPRLMRSEVTTVIQPHNPVQEIRRGIPSGGCPQAGAEKRIVVEQLGGTLGAIDVLLGEFLPVWWPSHFGFPSAFIAGRLFSACKTSNAMASCSRFASAGVIR